MLRYRSGRRSVAIISAFFDHDKNLLYRESTHGIQRSGNLQKKLVRFLE